MATTPACKITDAIDSAVQDRRSQVFNLILGALASPALSMRQFSLAINRLPMLLLPLASVVSAIEAATPLPPVKLLAWRRGFFVLDGVHRVAASRQLGYTHVPARVFGRR